ncbi:MAG: PKD domain-containing protein [Bacteroidia bacterium]|nr:PKD domain-containing protein [Bacteroidia bacterium]
MNVTITNDNGCSHSTSASVTVNLSPTAIATISDTAGCQPLSVSFGNNSLNADSYVWYFGDGNTSAGFTASHIYTQHGLFSPYLVAISNNGCTDTLYLPQVHVKQTPVASFTASSTGLCPSTLVTLISTSTGTSNPTYLWTLGNLFSNQPSPSWTLSNPGFYTVSLTVTNDNGCSDLHTEVDLIEVYDTIPPPVTPLLSVSVLNNTSTELKWMPSPVLDLYEYRLFRYNQTTANYDLIYTLVDTNNTNPNVNLVYVDNGLNTLNNVYTYKLQTVDRCQYKLPLSQSQAHTTINVTAQTQGTNIKVTWTPYGGCPVSVYEINRIELPSGSSQMVGSVSGNGPLTFTDTTLNCPFPYSYRITARDLCGNPYHSLSDTAVATPLNALAGQKVEIVRSTVIFNKNVLTEWSAPNMAPDRVMKYNILRSTDNFNFSVIASVPAGNYSYIDNSVNVNKNHYYYKVDVINDCSLSGALSNEGSSILLQSEWRQERTNLNWSEYKEWDTGVDYYIIEKRNSDGQWIQIKIVDGNETETVIDE